jgi:hypothetical protein
MLLSEFSAAAGNLTGSLEDLAAGTQLDKAAPILEQLEMMAQELVKQIDGITVEALRRQAEGMDEHSGTVFQLTFDFFDGLPVVLEASPAQLSSDGGLLAFPPV